MSKDNLVTLTAKGEFETGRTNKVQIRDHTSIYVDEPERLGGKNTGPNPLEYFLGSLSAWTSIVASMVADEMNFSYEELKYSADGKLDRRGYHGAEGVQTYFQEIEIKLEIETEESDERLSQLVAEVERRCPLYNLAKDAGVEVIINWV